MVNKNATEQLKRLSQNAFQECCQQLYSSWQKCIGAQGSYFEGNVACMIALFLPHRNKVISGTF
jgi:hypothetical protein